MDFSQIASEDKIKRAYEDGEFKDLPGYGKALKLEDLSSIPQELRMAYKMMKNAGMINEESALKQELLTIEDLIDKCQDPDEEILLRQKLSQKKLRMNQLMKKRNSTNSAVFKDYQSQINNKYR